GLNRVVVQENPLLGDLGDIRLETEPDVPVRPEDEVRVASRDWKRYFGDLPGRGDSAERITVDLHKPDVAIRASHDGIRLAVGRGEGELVDRVRQQAAILQPLHAGAEGRAPRRSPGWDSVQTGGEGAEPGGNAHGESPLSRGLRYNGDDITWARRPYARAVF